MRIISFIYTIVTIIYWYLIIKDPTIETMYLDASFNAIGIILINATTMIYCNVLEKNNYVKFERITNIYQSSGRDVEII